MSVINNLNLTTPPASAPGLRPQQFYDKVLLKTLRQRSFMHSRFAQTRTIPKNSGTKVVNFRRIGTLPPALTPLTEGVTPAGEVATKTNITASVNQYGTFMAFSDVVNFEEIDPIISEYSIEQGYQAAETKDILVREVLAGGTNVIRAGDAANMSAITSADKFSLEDARKIVREFRKNHVKPVYNGNYVCYISPDTELDLMDDPSFQKFMEYGNTNKPMLENEIGTIFGITFMRMTNTKVFEVGYDPDDAGALTPLTIPVHASIFLGADAYGEVNTEGEGAVKTIVKGLGSGGTEDPIDQRQTIGWKLNSYGAVRLQELAIYRYEHAVS